MIIGTAGHIDHGKTTLVRALTGVDTDRLKEEKARGISIELGYAYVPLADGDILGFIDVPGHERLVHTMVAGASGIDFALLVVAADDGIMPQSREHLAILALLGVNQGAIALTKSDRVDATRLAQVKAEIDAWTHDTFLRNAPVFPVAAAAPGTPGVNALRDYLHHAAGAMAARDGEGLFRLAVDRVFTLPGQGTIVTGTAHGGSLHLGDDGIDLRLMPAGQPVRLRSIHAQNRPAQQARAGQRCALNLAGLDKAAVKRGDWIADARCFLPARNIDVEIELLPSSDQAIRAWTPLHIHLGAAHFHAHAVPLSPDKVEAGQAGKIQWVFDEPICAMPGDRFIIRNAQANQTIGGGRVLDPEAPARKRRSTGRLAWLDAVSCMLTEGDLDPVLRLAPMGLGAATLTRLSGRPADQANVSAAALWVGRRGRQTSQFDAHHSHGILIHSQQWRALGERVMSALDTFHRTSPDEPGVESARLKRIALPNVDEVLWIALQEHLLKSGEMQRNGPWLHRPNHVSMLSPEETALADRLLPLIHAGAFDPPWVRDLARMQEEPEDRVRILLRKLLRRGALVQIVTDLFYHHERIAELAALAATEANDVGVTAAVFRDRTGLGRKRAIQVLEFFDRVGYTRRRRDAHVVRGSAGFFERSRDTIR